MKKYFVLILIVVLAFLLRFYLLGKIPGSMNIDEVSIGYNAYSVLKTGRDEFGKFLPMAFRSYDDYKPPLYIYLVVPVIGVLGLTDFAVRFPSALLGTLAILTTYGLVRELFPDKKGIALLSSFLLAIAPWHLQFTRTAFEVGSMAFFTTFGLWTFLLGTRKRSFWLLILSGIIFALSTYLYQAARLFTPMLLILLGSAYFLPLLFKRFKETFFLVAVFFLGFLIFFVPVLFQFFSPEGQTRFKGTSVFQNFEPHESGVRWSQTDWLARNRWGVILFHPEAFYYLHQILVNYFTHLRPDFLFLGLSGVKVNLIPNIGLEPLWTLPFLVLGLFRLFGNKEKRVTIFLLGWMLIAPIPAALTWEVPTSVRTAVMLPVLEILCAIGAYVFFLSWKVKSAWKNISIFALTLVCVYFTVYTLHMMFVHGPKYWAKQWYSPYRQVVQKTMALAPKYSKVIVNTNLDQPHGFFLYYSTYDPDKYLKEGGTKSGSFTAKENRMGNVYFTNTPAGEVKEKKVLYVGKSGDFIPEERFLAEFKFETGESAVKIVEKN